MTANRWRAVVLLDRDGTLIEDTGYVNCAEDVRLLPRAAEALALLRAEGVALVVTTNQGGIGRGIISEAQYRETERRFGELLAASGVGVDATYFCPAAPDAGDIRRKPGRGMYDDACRDLPIAGLPVFAVGDKLSDVELGANAGGRGMMVMTGNGSSESHRVPAGTPVCLDILDAAERILTRLVTDAKSPADPLSSKLRGLTELGEELGSLRASGRRIVLANGCFDLLHGGHIDYMEAARAQGDMLVLAINSNRSIRELKGAGRPVLPEPDRLQVLAALECVDRLALFYEATADRALRVLHPDVHAKGTDYTSETVPERETARELGISTFIAGAPKENSTRDIITTICERARAGLLD